MSQSRWAYAFVVLLILGLCSVVGFTSIQPSLTAPSPQATPSGRVATPEELAQAQLEWERSGHADTYDNGMGANTTCARCKSPKNWDPSQDLAAMEALDCGACKRVPGAPRPELLSGEAVLEEDWEDIRCEICHIPAGDSYYADIAYWNQSTGAYEPVEDVLELCAKCHEGQHGFEVIEEQVASVAHAGWDCTLCHGPHGAPSNCQDCHDPTQSSGAFEHSRHDTVNCTACHDAGHLSIWKESNPDSAHFGEVITIRFAHTLTAWPSHNLSSEVVCERCHHPTTTGRAAVDPDTSCEACHPGGAMWIWCDLYPQDPDPNAATGKSQ
jgi:hypothetical protein